MLLHLLCVSNSMINHSTESELMQFQLVPVEDQQRYCVQPDAAAASVEVLIGCLHIQCI